MDCSKVKCTYSHGQVHLFISHVQQMYIHNILIQYIHASVYEQISTAKHGKKLQVWSKTNIPLSTCEHHTPALAEMLLQLSIHYPTVGDVSFPWSTMMAEQLTQDSEWTFNEQPSACQVTNSVSCHWHWQQSAPHYPETISKGEFKRQNTS